MFRADYTYNIEDGVLVIIDLNCGGKSVTNDMESVLADIVRAEGVIPGLIIYRDSEGIYDQTWLVNGVAQFKSLGNTTNQDEAISRLKKDK